MADERKEHLGRVQEDYQGGRENAPPAPTDPDEPTGYDTPSERPGGNQDPKA